MPTSTSFGPCLASDAETTSRPRPLTLGWRMLALRSRLRGSASDRTTDLFCQCVRVITGSNMRPAMNDNFGKSHPASIPLSMRLHFIRSLGISAREPRLSRRHFGYSGDH